MERLIEIVQPYFESWGYLIVFATTLLENSAFLALVIPGDAILLLAGFYAQRGALSLPAVMVIAFVGAVLGDTIAYVIGRFAGRRIVERWGGKRFLPQRRLERFERYFDEYGMWAVAIGRITPLFRAFNTFVAGMSRMPFWRFLAAVILVVAVWSTTIPILGFLFSGSLEVLQRYLRWGGPVVFVAFIVVLVTTYRRMVKRLEARVESRAASSDG